MQNMQKELIQEASITATMPHKYLGMLGIHAHATVSRTGDRASTSGSGTLANCSMVVTRRHFASAISTMMPSTTSWRQLRRSLESSR